MRSVIHQMDLHVKYTTEDTLLRNNRINKISDSIDVF